MRKIWERIKDESAGALIESVIVLPLVFVVIYSLIMTAFIMHDRATIEAAAQRGAIYAANCVSDPAYASLMGQNGELDIKYDKDITNLSFSGVSKNIEAYRYFTGGADVTANTEKQVKKIVEKTRIAWLPQDTVKVDCTQKNMFLYQDITVTVKATYKIPVVYSLFGLETNYKYEATANIRTTDPDEFIRNADLIVDIITELISKFDKNGYVQKAIDKISELGTKIIDWL